MPLSLAPPIEIVQQAPVAAQGEATAPLRVDIKGRPMIPVTIDGKGPFDMIVDTGAAGTVMHVETAQALQLPKSGDAVRVAGVARGEDAALYRLNSLASPLFTRTDLTVPGLSSIGTTQARAVLGMDLFADRKLVLDRGLQEVRVAPSGPAPADFDTIAGAFEPSDGLIVPLRLNGVEVEGLIDSGAEASVISGDIVSALGWKPDDARFTDFGQVGGAGGGGAAARIATLEQVQLGSASFAGVKVIFMDGGAPPAEPGRKPRMIIGLNLLNRLKVYAVDAPRGEFQFRTLAIPGR